MKSSDRDIEGVGVDGVITFILKSWLVSEND
jgi:hypothetical protein